MHRRSSGNKGNVLVDIFIGAQAALGCAILIRDASRHRNYFRHMPLIVPEAG